MMSRSSRYRLSYSLIFLVLLSTRIGLAAPPQSLGARDRLATRTNRPTGRLGRLFDSWQVDRKFNKLQRSLRKRGRLYDWSQPREIIVLPSLSVDRKELRKIRGYKHYEERMLFTLAQLAHPTTKVTFVSTIKVDPKVIDYYLDKLPDPKSARKRLKLVSVYDSLDEVPKDKHFESLASRLVSRGDLREKILAGVDHDITHIYPFVATNDEKRLAVQLGIPLLATDPKLARLGDKDGGRQSAIAAGVAPAPGIQKRVKREAQLVREIERFVTRYPTAEALMIKLTQSFSGEGNAKLDLRGLAKLGRSARRKAIRERLPKMKFMAGPKTNWQSYRDQMSRLGAVIELFMPGVIDSPSVQLYIGPDKQVEVLSTFTQKLSGQEYMGGSSPAEKSLLSALHEAGLKVGHQLAKQGAMGRLGVDFVVTQCPDCGERKLPKSGLYYIETNLRLGGTTHSVNMLRLLMSTPKQYANYDLQSGAIISARSGRKIYHVVTDNADKELPAAKLAGLTPEQVISRIRKAGLDWNPKTEEGIVLHLLGAVRDFGKVGFTAAASSPARARTLYKRAIAALATP
jgi:hypothetical protein